MSERSSAQTNAPTSANIQYNFTPPHFDQMNIPPMHNAADMYSYYPQNLYTSFNVFDDQTQWTSVETPANVQPGQVPFHPSMYTPSPIDISRGGFEYPPAPHHYPHFHHPFQHSPFAPPPTTGASGFDIPWNHQNVSMAPMTVAPQPPMAPIGVGLPASKKPSTFDEHSASGGSDKLAQQFQSSVNIGATSNHDEANSFDNGNHDNSAMSSSKEQQQCYQSASNHMGFASHASALIVSSNGPKSYASVVGTDMMNPNSNKSIPSVSNLPVRSMPTGPSHEHLTADGNFSNDSNNVRSNLNNRTANNFNNTNNYNQNNRTASSGYNPRDSKQSNPSNPNAVNWSNQSPLTNTRGSNQNNNSTSTYYNRQAYSQQQNPSMSTHYLNNRRNNSYHQNTHSSSRGAHSGSNGSASSAGDSQQPMTAANEEVLDKLKQNHQYNPAEFNLNPKGARFFVIKSYSEDDVHRSIKYNIWCSTEHGNKRLDDAFREREGKGPIYLFFSVNASGHFCGMAEMMSPVDYEHKTDVWQTSNKWHGKFEVKWIYVKDVPNQQFRGIRLENNDNKPVTNSRDTQEIPYEKGRQMLRILHSFPHKTSIFDDFQYYESKQAEEKCKKPTSNDQNNSTSARGYFNNRRPYSSNRTAAMNNEQQQQYQHHHYQQQQQQQQQGQGQTKQQQTFENIQHNEQQ